jgi:hypothetical protein
MKKSSMAMNYIQSCWDCGVTPDKRTLKKFKKQEEEEWSIRELDDYRRHYEED